MYVSHGGTSVVVRRGFKLGRGNLYHADIERPLLRITLSLKIQAVKN